MSCQLTQQPWIFFCEKKLWSFDSNQGQPWPEASKLTTILMVLWCLDNFRCTLISLEVWRIKLRNCLPEVNQLTTMSAHLIYKLLFSSSRWSKLFNWSSTAWFWIMVAMKSWPLCIHHGLSIEDLELRLESNYMLLLIHFPFLLEVVVYTSWKNYGSYIFVVLPCIIWVQ